MTFDLMKKWRTPIDMFDMVDTPLSYERKLIVCSFLQDWREKEATCNQSAMHILHFNIVGKTSTEYQVSRKLI